MRNLLVYIAGPIVKGDLRANIRQACDAAKQLMHVGIPVIVPHLSCYIRQVYAGDGCLPEAIPAGTTLADWYGMDLVILRRCSALLRLPGEGVGSDGEVAEARKHLIPVFFTIPELLAWAEAYPCQDK